MNLLTFFRGKSKEYLNQEQITKNHELFKQANNFL